MLKKIGKFEILGELGQGGMGVVYKAFDPFVKRIVAVKTLSADLSADRDARARFMREAAAIGMLSGDNAHPNIVVVYDLFEEGNHAYMVMEFLDGISLAQLISSKKVISIERQIDIVTEICKGLQHAHDEGIVHRDVKPGNIFLTKKDQIKLLDFGLAHIAASTLTRTNSRMGTPHYMAPEQWSGDDVDARTDIFAIGVVLYELLTHRRPFRGNNLGAIGFQAMRIKEQPAHEINPAVPEELSRIVGRAMAKKPEDRYQDARALIVELRGARGLAGGRMNELSALVGRAAVDLEELVHAHRTVLEHELAGQLLDTENVTDMRLIALLRPTEVGLNTELVDAPTMGQLLEEKTTLHRQRERLLSLVDQVRHVSSDLTQAEELERRGKLGDALLVAKPLAESFPQVTRAKVLESRLRIEFQRAQEAVQRQEAFDKLLGESRSALTEGALQRSIEKIDEALQLKPGDAAASSVRKLIVSKVEEERARKAQAQELLKAAEEALAGHDAGTCLAHVAKAEELDPGLAEVAEVRSKAEKQQQAQQALDAASKAISLARFDQARQSVGRAKKLFPSLPSIPGLEHEIHEAEERKKRVEFLLGRAQLMDEVGEEDKAVECLEELLGLQSDNASGHSLSMEIRERREAREIARRELDERHGVLLAQAREAETSRDYIQAIELAHSIVSENAEHQEAKELLARCTRQKKELDERRSKVEKFARAARSLMVRGDESEALEQISEALRLEPDHGSSQALRLEIAQRIELREQAEAAKREKVARLVEEARAAQASGQFEEALQLAQEALVDDADNEQAQELVSEADAALKELTHERERVRQLLSEARSFGRAGDERRALSCVDKLLELEPENEAAITLRRNIQERQESRSQAGAEHRQWVASSLSEALDAEAAGGYEKARELGKAVLEEQSDHTEALRIVARAESSLEEVAELRARIEALLKEARGLDKAKDEEQALARLDELLELDPDHAAAQNFKEQIEKRRDIREQQRRKQIAANLQRARKAEAQGKLDQAIDLAREVLEQEESEKEARELIERVERRGQIASRAEELIEEARKLLRNNDDEAALGQLEELFVLDAEHAPALALKNEIGDRQAARERERQARIRSVLERAGEAESRGDLRQALELANTVLGDEPAHAEAGQLVERVKHLEAEVSRLFNEASSREEAGDETGAMHGLTDLLKLKPDHEAALRLRKDVAERQQSRERDRRKQLAANLEAARQTHSEGELTEALKMARAVLAEDAGHTVARDLASRINKELEAKDKHRQEAADLLKEVRDLDERGKQELALAKLERILALDPEHRPAKELERQIRERAQRAETLYQKALRSESQGNLKKALELAQASVEADQRHDKAQRLVARLQGPMPPWLRSRYVWAGAAAMVVVAVTLVRNLPPEPTTDPPDSVATIGAGLEPAEPSPFGIESEVDPESVPTGGEISSEPPPPANEPELPTAPPTVASNPPGESDSTAPSETAVNDAEGPAELAPEAESPVVSESERPPPTTEAPAPEAAPELGSPVSAEPEIEPEPEPPPPIPPPPVDPMAIERDRINALVAAYEAAYESLDADALARIWPSVDASALQGAFDNLTSVTLMVIPQSEVAIQGDSAEVTYKVQTDAVTRFGKKPPITENNRLFRFQKTGDAWTIVSVTIH